MSSLRPAERADGWRAVVAETHLPWRIDSVEAARRPFDARLMRLRLGGLDLVDCSCDVSRGERGRRELRETEGEFVGVLCVLRGREVLEQGGRSVELRDGQIALWDSARPARFAVGTPLVKRTLLVPRERLAALCGDPGRLTASPPTSPASAMLIHAHLGAVRRAAGRLDATALRAAAEAALELVGAAFGPACRASSGAIDAALLARIDDYIDRHLCDPALGPRRLAAAHAISLRSLHALFEPRGESVAARVRRLRLEGARADLERSGGEPIAEVARRWGFGDPAHFSRLFRRRYGEAPRDARARAGPSDASAG